MEKTGTVEAGAPGTVRVGSRPSLWGGLGGVALGSWMAVALLISLATISDPDLGFHIAWGRFLGHHFSEAGSQTLGQDRSVTVYAYSYWLYQRSVVWLHDAVGSWSLVLLRAVLVLATLGLGIRAARRLGARSGSRALFLAVGILMAFERFVDRPDVVSHLAWMAALWILLFHRHGRGIWLLLPLEVFWVNTHLYFSLLPPLFVLFALSDLRGGGRQVRRAALVLGGLILASFLNPVGPGAWASQLQMIGFAAGRAFALPIQEMISPYANRQPFLSTWAFRFAMPVCVVLAVAGRRRLGLGGLLALLSSAALGALAQRAVSLFAVTAIALVPPAFDFVAERTERRLGATAARVIGAGPILLSLALGLAGVIGLLNGQIFLRLDKAFRIPDFGPPRFEALGAARFLRTESVQGPIFHNPVSAGAILMENGTRLTPFMDARWLPTDEAAALYLRMVAATEADAAELWGRARRTHGFEAVILDFYEMPALLRHFAVDPDWPLVYSDDGAAVFCRRGGSNDAVIAKWEPEVAARWARPDTLREAALGREILRHTRSRPPSLWTRVSFPWDSFRRGNFALQVRSRPEAQAAYLELFRREGGSLHLSRHRQAILGNALWCLMGSSQWEAQSALCAVLIESRETAPGSRAGLRVARAESLVHLGRTAEAEQSVREVLEDPAAVPETRLGAWSVMASAREAAGDHAGAIEACRAAARLRPDAAEPHRTIGRILDTRLARPQEALRAYETYRSLGGADLEVEQRIVELRRMAR